MKLTDKELATVLAALRYWQDDLEENNGHPAILEYFEEVDPLSVDEIDELCEKLNTED